MCDLWLKIDIIIRGQYVWTKTWIYNTNSLQATLSLFQENLNMIKTNRMWDTWTILYFILVELFISKESIGKMNQFSYR